MYINNYDSWQGFGQLRSLINPKQLFLCGLFWAEIPRGFTFFILSTAPPSGLYCCFDIYLAAKPWRITTRYKAWRISDKSAQGLNKAVRSLPGATKTYTILVSIAEPLARLRVTQRRLSLMTAEMFTASSVFVNGKLKVDYAGGCAYLDENELHLTPIEYKLLCLLSKNVGKVLTHTFITQNIWGRSWDNDVASLRVFMATLRKKLEPTEESPQYIQTHIGVGYRMIKVE